MQPHASHHSTDNQHSMSDPKSRRKLVRARDPSPVLERNHAPVGDGVRIVAVGASAGGADAFAELFAALPSRTGLAFVVIQHLDASHTSMLAAILQRSTSMPVQQAEDGDRAEADKVYVIPPDRELSVTRGVLRLKARPGKVPHRPIDHFFLSLARDQQCRAVGVVLSGNDHDGSAGLQAIRDAAGITFVQDDSAHFGVMPSAAASAADFVLRPADIAAQIVRIAAGGDPPAADGDGERFGVVLRLVRERFGADFSSYKKPSIHRRILRRMLLDGYSDIDEYARGLASDERQLETLHQDLLIGVTAFFREPKQFEALRLAAFPALLPEARTEPFRVWVAGCSTGEEVYSVAMAVLEYLDGRNVPLTVFGTDINAKALEIARTGIYTERMLANVSPARRERFFTQVPGGFRISRQVRDLCVFARHDVANDPPYSNIDLLTCCNVLIYFGRELQQRALKAIHYALAPGGLLMLGTAESLRATSLFSKEFLDGTVLPEAAERPQTAREAQCAARPDATRRLPSRGRRARRESSGRPVSDRPPAAERCARQRVLRRHSRARRRRSLSPVRAG
jgi:two-component system, chemotaxis family, CheB/CheR fusion protein